MKKKILLAELELEHESAYRVFTKGATMVIKPVGEIVTEPATAGPFYIVNGDGRFITSRWTDGSEARIKEPWCEQEGQIVYAGDYPPQDDTHAWNPPRTMNREHSRRICGKMCIGVARLKELSTDQLCRTGYKNRRELRSAWEQKTAMKYYYKDKGIDVTYDANPWVWLIDISAESVSAPQETTSGTTRSQYRG